MTTKVSILDCGCGVEVEVHGREIKVIHSGGTPVEEILAGTRFGLPVERVADLVMRRWLRGYEGGLAAARENNLRVSVRRNESEATETP